MKTLYEANDGELFEDKEACLEHERAISRPFIYIAGNITKIVRKRNIDETGIHYPVSELIVAETYGFGSRQATQFYHVPINPYIAPRFKGCFQKGAPIHVSGQVVAKTRLVNNMPVADLTIINAGIEMCKPRKRVKKGA